MNTWFTPLSIWTLFFLLAAGSGFSQTNPLKLIPIATHFTGQFNVDAAESVAFDAATKRLFFTNRASNQVQILDINNPSAPVLVDSIKLQAYGDQVTGVAIHNGSVAVSVAAFPYTDPGKVVLFDLRGGFQAQFTVGAFPNALVFSPDGKRIVVANGGTPSEDYSVDPEGSVSIIEWETGSVRTASFGNFNNQAASLRNRGVRLFNPNASVAKEVEPESLTVSADGKKAFVTLQENNALAIVDIESARVIDVQALGDKDHHSGAPAVTEITLQEHIELPMLGKPVYQDSLLPAIQLGGFSGLYFDQGASSDSIAVLYTLTDRGPTDAAIPTTRGFGAGNEQAFSDLRPYKLPDLQARLVRLHYHKRTAKVTLDSQIYLSRMQNSEVVPITGRTNIIGYDEIPVTYAKKGTPYTVEDWLDTLTKTTYTELPFDPFGGDLEGVVRDRDGFFWVCDDMRPSLYKFQPNGLMVARYVPRGTSALGLIDLGQGAYGDESLPSVYRKRWANRGFEAIAYDADHHIIYAFIQSPIFNPGSAIENQSDIIRILGVNAATGVPVSEYVYVLENNSTHSPERALSRVDKIVDAVYQGDGNFLVLETDSSPAGQSTAKKMVYQINIRTATNLLASDNLTKLSDKEKSSGPSDKTLEMMQAADLAAVGIRPVYKRKVLNLPSMGYVKGASPEGLTVLGDGSLAVLNDNDYGIANGAASDASVLGIIAFDSNYGLDASDRDGQVHIANQPVLGLYQPDAIQAFTQSGKTYLLTANEGASRAVPGQSEETRIGASTFTLDPQAFPDAPFLKQDAHLGRLHVSNSSGDLDHDGDFDVLYAFGGRSFSVRDTFGNLLYDSGDAFETAVRDHPIFSPYFNTPNSSNAAEDKDSRSDDKGPEPTALEVVVIDQIPYALIGLKQIGGIMAFDLSKPEKPTFAGYFNNRNFTAAATSKLAGDLGIEEICFIPATESPNGIALVVTANAVSGTVTIFSTRETTTDVEKVAASIPWSFYPNPASDYIFTSAIGDYQVFNTLGQLMLQTRETREINLRSLPEGTYILRSRNRNGSKLFVITR